MSKIQAWGRLSHSAHQIKTLLSPTHVAVQLQQAAQGKQKSGIAHGMGRSYGDAALNADGIVWLTTGLNHMIAFDPIMGQLHCEAGISLQEIHRTLIPQGWMLPVSPGTQMISVGGAIANDVHGKNHHQAGSFGDHVLSIKLLRSDGEVIECSHQHHADWFYATLGGIGLTGIIVEARLQLKSIPSPWVLSETLAYHNLDEFFALSESSVSDWEHTVSWIDCINGPNAKGLFMRANMSAATPQESPKLKHKRFPFTPPISLVNKLSLRLFNLSYFHANLLKTQPQTSYFEPFFYPLDALHDWNKIYGPQGFYQYQSLIPTELGKEATQEMLKIIKKSGQGSFLAVLKTLGARESGGLLSFPKAGITLALDFPNRGASTLKLFSELDRVVEQAQGRLYLAKDARMPRSLFESGYPRFHELLKYKDPGMSSDMSRRLFGA